MRRRSWKIEMELDAGSLQELEADRMSHEARHCAFDDDAGLRDLEVRADCLAPRILLEAEVGDVEDGDDVLHVGIEEIGRSSCWRDADGNCPCDGRT